MVVQSRLADGHTTLVGGQRLELGKVSVIEAGRLARVTSDRHVDLRKVLGRRERRAA